MKIFGVEIGERRSKVDIKIEKVDALGNVALTAGGADVKVPYYPSCLGLPDPVQLTALTLQSLEEIGIVPVKKS